MIVSYNGGDAEGWNPLYLILLKKFEKKKTNIQIYLFFDTFLIKRPWSVSLVPSP